MENKPNDVPSGGNYTVTDPATGILCSATTFEGLVNRVGQVRAAIGARAGLSLREELEKAVCEAYPKDCIPVDMKIPRKRNFNLTDVIRGSHVMIKAFIQGSKPVPREEAERRAQICLACPYNTNYPKPCTGVCGELMSIALRVSGSQGTQYDRGLHSCGVCGCLIMAAIWMPLDVQCVGVNDDMKSQFKYVGCWKQCP